MVEFEEQAGNSGGSANRARISLSHGACQEFEGLVLDWLYRQDEISVVAEIESKNLEELLELFLGWSRMQIVVQSEHCVSSEQRQQFYSAIVSRYHSETSYSQQSESIHAEFQRRATLRAAKRIFP